MNDFSHRVAQVDDLNAIRGLMHRAIEHLQRGFLSPEQVRASHAVMGLDSQLVRDGTYLLVEHGNRLAGCGGWSWRATLFGGDNSIVAREPAPLDPATDSARVRAMYTDPDYARRGVGRMILSLCEDAARAHGFHRTEMMATLAGEPLYRAAGYAPVEHVHSSPVDGVCVPLVRMVKDLSRP